MWAVVAREKVVWKWRWLVFTSIRATFIRCLICASHWLQWDSFIEDNSEGSEVLNGKMIDANNVESES